MGKYFALSVLLFSFAFGFAQEKIEVTEENHSFSVGEQHAYVTKLLGVEMKDVKTAWKKKLKSMKAKVSTDDGEMFGDNAVIKSFPDNNPVDIYTIFEDEEDGVRMYSCVNLGGAYLSDAQAEKSKLFRDLIYDFALTNVQKGIMKQLKAAKNLLKKQQSAQKKLVSKKESLENKIKKYQEKIEDAKKDIEENVKAQAKKAEEIEAQQKVVDEIQAKLDAFK